jgi:hypothetical protein
MSRLLPLSSGDVQSKHWKTPAAVGRNSSMKLSDD